jgi:hypothetical protein
MALEDRIERAYLHLWRAVVLFVATASLLVAVAASFAAIGGLFGAVPPRPLWSRLAERGEELKRELVLENYREAQPTADGGSRETRHEEMVRRIVDNLDRYVRTAHPERTPDRGALAERVRKPLEEPRLQARAHRALYLTTLASLAQELARAAAAQAQLPVERRLEAERVLRWHADAVRRMLSALEEENQRLDARYQQDLAEYARRHTKVLSYSAIAGAAFFVFVLMVALFFVVKIQRDLHTMAHASLLTVRQLEAGKQPEG